MCKTYCRQHFVGDRLCILLHGRSGFWYQIMAFEQPIYPTTAFEFLTHSQSPTFDDTQHSLDHSQPSERSHAPDSLPALISDPAWVKPRRQTVCPLDIIVVGAGLGGLAAAIALALSGHKVRVFEQAPVFGEVGAGIQVPPNSTRLFLSWGVGPHIEQCVSEPKTINIRRWRDGSLIGTTHLNPDFRLKYQAPYFVLHRADYHSALLNRAKELGVVIDGDSEVESYSFPPSPSAESASKHASITLRNGKVHSADLVVGTDGVKSLARTVMLASHGLQPVLPQPTSEAAYRCTIPLHVLASNPATAWVTETPNQNLWIGPGRHTMTYAIGGAQSPNRLFNLVLCHPETRPPDQWPSDMTELKEEVRATFTGWDERFKQILNQVLDHPNAKIVKWPISTITPLPTWTHRSGHMIVLGDAAHAMVPYMSQGAAIAVEDAAALAAVLARLTTRADLSRALSVLETVRRVRAEGMQQASLLNGRIWHLDDGLLQRARDAAMADRGVASNANQWSDATCQRWTYGYDAVDEVEKAWMEQVGVDL